MTTDREKQELNQGPAAPGTARHTPGPWFVSNRGGMLTVGGPSGAIVSLGVPTPQRLADAKLIAEAPALADALQMAFENADHHASCQQAECRCWRSYAAAALRAAARLP